MIPIREQRDTIDARKPRASGDDPGYAGRATFWLE